jgi:hypothetical protein
MRSSIGLQGHTPLEMAVFMLGGIKPLLYQGYYPLTSAHQEAVAYGNKK